MIIHVTQLTDHRKTWAKLRHRVAVASWERLYDRGRVTPAFFSNPTRTAQLIGDKRDVPYVKDILQHGMKRAGDNDIIMFTNGDIVFNDSLPASVEDRVSTHGFCSCLRVDFNEPSKVLYGQTPAQWNENRDIKDYNFGRDLFAFSKPALVQFLEVFPDMFIGTATWDWCALAILHLWNNINLCKETFSNATHPTDIPCGNIAHITHLPEWCKTHVFNDSPASMHNHSAFHQFCDEHGLDMFIFKNNRMVGIKPNNAQPNHTLPQRTAAA